MRRPERSKVRNSGSRVWASRAESRIYRGWGVDVIGMTNIPEAKLAREAEISYATLALSTDYDCWHEGHDDVSIEAVLAIIHSNVEMAQKIIQEAVTRIPFGDTTAAHRALENAILTDRALIPAATRERLALIASKYLG